MGYINVSYQAATLGLSIVLGVVLCLLYDLVRALHKICIKGFFEVLVCDVVYFGISAVITFCFLIIRCQGEVRLFVLVGQLVGFVALRLTVSRFVLKVFILILSFIFRAFEFIGSTLVAFLKKLKNFFKKMLIYAKKLLQPKCKLLYNQVKVRIFKITTKKEI
jgi:hypothetical protein